MYTKGVGSLISSILSIHFTLSISNLHPFHIPNRNVPGAPDSESSSSYFSLGAIHKLGPFAGYLQTPQHPFGPMSKAGQLDFNLSLKERNIARK
jgi:hypothetical protein